MFKIQYKMKTVLWRVLCIKAFPSCGAGIFSLFLRGEFRTIFEKTELILILRIFPSNYFNSFFIHFMSVFKKKKKL